MAQHDPTHLSDQAFAEAFAEGRCRPRSAGLPLGGRRSFVRSLGAAQATLDLPIFKYLACRKYH